MASISCIKSENQAFHLGICTDVFFQMVNPRSYQPISEQDQSDQSSEHLVIWDPSQFLSKIFDPKQVSRMLPSSSTGIQRQMTWE
jgi:hypothetical protein